MATWSTLPSPSDDAPGPGVGAKVARLVVPLVVAGVLFWWGHRVMAIVVVAIGLTIGVAGLASSAADRGLARAAAWLGRVVGGFLSSVLLGIVYVAVFTVVALVLRLLGRDPTHSSADPARPSYWGLTRRDVQGTLVRWQFAHESRLDGSARPSLLRTVVGFAVAVFVLNLAGGVLLHAVGLGEPAPADPRRDRPAYHGQEWVGTYFDELRESRQTRYDGFSGWRRRDFAGETITVVDGVRRSYEPELPRGVEPLEVVFLGGSTMWGTGNRDLHTIPSAFARLCERNDIPVRVTKLGEKGYVSWQEVLLLAERCALGDVPDLAIFYDGVNDVFVQVQEATERPRPQNFPQLRDRFEHAHALVPTLARYSFANLLFRHLRRAPEPRGLAVEALPGGVDELAANVATIYAASIDHARRLATAYGFDVAAFWQPCVYTKRTVEPGEEAPRDEYAPALDRLYDAATARVVGADGRRGQVATSLTHVFDTSPAPLMIDWCHTNEEGAALVARAMFDVLGPTLREMANGTAALDARHDATAAGASVPGGAP